MKFRVTVTFLQLKVLTTYRNMPSDLTKEYMPITTGADVKIF